LLDWETVVDRFEALLTSVVVRPAAVRARRVTRLDDVPVEV
jgi:hypothetical protein